MLQARWLVGLVLLSDIACKRESRDESAGPTVSAAPSASAASVVKKARKKAKVAAPPIPELSDRTVTFAGKETKVVVCKLDTAAPLMRDKDWWHHEDDAMYGIEHATRCGDDLCVLDAVLTSTSVLRWTMDGKFLGKVRISDVDLSMSAQRIGWSKAGLWIGGAVVGNDKAWIGVVALLPSV